LLGGAAPSPTGTLYRYRRTARRTKKRLEALEVELEQLDLLELAYGISSAEWRASMRKS
jgi:hypothetical protein